MSIKNITGTGDVRRNKLACAVDFSDTETPDFRVVAYKITESALNFNIETETGTSIDGKRFGSATSSILTQSFEPHRVVAGDAGLLSAKLIHHIRNDELEKLSKFKCVLIWGLLGEDGLYDAEMYDECMVIPQSIGGSTYLDMPLEVTFGGNVVKGTADKLTGKITFTPDTPVVPEG